VHLPESALALLHERTEGWAAGLRLAALSLTGHPEPERFAAEFCGSERTVAEYLIAEVLERQSEEVRRLLSRTSVLQRVNGPLADVLTGGSGGGRILRQLEQAGALVVAFDARRSWFRYHRLLAGAGRLLADHWLDITLAGQAATVRQLVTSFPAAAVTANAELTSVAAAAELMVGSLAEGARYLALAEEAEQLRSVDALDAAQLGLGEELRALALISLGIADLCSSRLGEAEVHLELGVALARRIGRPLLEISALAHWGLVASFRSPALAVERGLQAIELAQRHGWGGEPLIAIAYPMLASSLISQGELDEAERWLMEGEYALRSEVEPVTGMLFRVVRAVLVQCQAGQRTAPPALMQEIVSVLGGRAPTAPTALTPSPAPAVSATSGVPAVPAARAAAPAEHLPEPLSQAETRVLRFLQTSLSAPEIARELYVSVNTVRTHMRHLYDKLGAHRRLEALDRARALGLLAPVPQRA
jgi:LuxR family transcriptional regulator, maltose regulon positive regulatory protein